MSRQERVAFSSIEYSVARWSPPVLLAPVKSVRLRPAARVLTSFEPFH